MMERMKELIALLHRASKAYYAEDREIMSDREYDTYYDELVGLEESTGVVLSGSPTREVGYEAVDSLPKMRHERPMLSLSKTKDRNDLAVFLGAQEGLLSWKLDGLTVVLTYEDGQLAQAVTRGNGEIGEVITPNARVFANIPLHISYTDRLVVRGEAVISYEDFEQVNENLPEGEDAYKNPRNLCSGSVRQLDSKITAARHVRLYAFSLVSAGQRRFQTRSEQFDFLRTLGFDVVEQLPVTAGTVVDAVASYEARVEEYGIPTDGLVLVYDDIAYSESLGSTAHAPRDAIAFKWADEVAETVLRMIEWSPSRTGRINPVAVFDPVELEGTTVSRASVHNLSIMRELRLGIGDSITVYKANMIIPQIAENLTQSDNVVIPDVCPACGGSACVQDDVLVCANPLCPAKRVKSYALLVSRGALNIDGLSEATLERVLIGRGFVHEYADLYRLERYRDKLPTDGFGEKSVDNLLRAVEASRSTELNRVLYGLGIPNVGEATAKLICSHYGYDTEAVLHAEAEELAKISGIGEVIAQSYVEYMNDPDNQEAVLHLLSELEIEVPKPDSSPQSLAGLTFVITGDLIHYPNRNALKAQIESMGGKVAGSVSGKTAALISNDSSSASSKSQKAAQLGIPVITEEEFVNKYL